MYCILTDKLRATADLPLNGNVVIYSLFKQFECKVPFDCFSIKYVTEGRETYHVNGQKYYVESGQYLLANQFAEGSVHIDSKQTVKGICINIANDVISQVVASSLRPDTPSPDCALEKYFTTTEFLENQYAVANTHAGAFLSKLDSELSKNPFQARQLSNEFYYNLAEHLVSDQAVVCKQMMGISSIKTATKKDLTRRVMNGKSFIDINFKSHLAIGEIARECGLSEYHFHRLFKAAYGTSPYQYLLNRRLNHALELFQKGNESLTEIAFEIGFADIYSFSKAFKKSFGIPPSSLLRQRISKDFPFQDHFLNEVTAKGIRQISQ